MAKVPWIVVRRVALARAMAIENARIAGKDWNRLASGTRDRLVRDAEERIIEWGRSGVLIQFSGDYRESEDGGDPLVEWQKTTRH